VRVLAIDTALNGCSVAITDDTAVLACLSEPMPRGQAERLAPMVDEALRAAGLSPAQLDRVAVTRGPGSFTGLRSGLAFARSFALALGVDCVGLDTLEALRVSVDPGREASILAAIGVGGTWYLAAWQQARLTVAPVRSDEPRNHLETLSADGNGWHLTGPAGPELASLWPKAGLFACDLPDPVALAGAARMLDPQQAPPVPLYLRGSDAKLPGGLVPAGD
jgi:tRNA threonylcarbamoyladenosine biosynthesis protein TsaB